LVSPTDHDAILSTDKTSHSTLPPTLRKIYDQIVDRFVGVFLHPRGEVEGFDPGGDSQDEEARRRQHVVQHPAGLGDALATAL
jgi:hypothetical protein